MIQTKDCAFMLCDIQDKFRNVILSFDLIVKVASRMISSSKILDIPLIVSEQYPKGLGKTVPELDVTGAKILEEKTVFSMMTSNVCTYLDDKKIKCVILFGLETHVCIFQTCLDLLARGLSVYVLVDGVSSRNFTDSVVALKQLQMMGVNLCTSEGVLFQLIRDKNHPKFRDIQDLIRNMIEPTEIALRM